MTGLDNMTCERSTILTISGSGRSGTTILSVLLTQDEGAFNIGQLRDALSGWATDVSCTCGATVNNCVFWGEVRRRAFPEHTAEMLAAEDADLRRFMSEAAQLADWNATSGLQDLAQAHRGFLDRLGRLLQVLVAVSGARLLVDSSKSPEFALACHLTDTVDLYVLNLVRDPRAVACSWAKKKPGRITQRLDAWGKRQRRLERWHDAACLHHRSLRYEDFTDAPQVALREALRWVGEDLPPDLFKDSRSARVTWARQHLFPPSNEAVLAEKRTEVEVRAPTDWRAPQHWPLHLRALVRSFPQGPAYVLGFGRSERRLKP
ncbi:sulfotransferase [Antarctobacter heliothermus]|uniref:Sulfotransferase family protein n=1 Tax=Antarctobacter heliothermus TaxID=74033 RepID=A0A239JNY4_9RHOB|nr:sulfotransferase [Antarctobacter heliothermus]SNT07128.1 Sulfotransferase family protein [Antarctobacter heliothermus]